MKFVAPCSSPAENKEQEKKKFCAAGLMFGLVEFEYLDTIG